MKHVLSIGGLLLGVAAFQPSVASAFPFTDGMDANYRQGQVDFTSGFEDFETSTFFGAKETSASTLFSPVGVDFDVGSNLLAVADALNRRVLIFSANGGSTFQGDALLVLGQPDMTTGGADSNDPFGASNTPNPTNGCQPGVNACGLRRPFDVVVDSANSRLFVSDPSNRRVLIWDLSNPSNGDAATRVLGQSSMMTDDRNQACGSTGDGTTNACGMSFPGALALDKAGERLFVSDDDNNRVTVFDVSGEINNGMPAIAVLGQAGFNSNDEDQGCGGGNAGLVNPCGLNAPDSLAWDAVHQRLFVGETNNHRVLVFAAPSGFENGKTASNVLGQPDLATGTANTDCGGGLHGETNTNRCGLGIFGLSLAISSDGGTLFVSDGSNHRVLAFDVTEISDGENAINVFGQPNFIDGYDPSDPAYGGGTARERFTLQFGVSVDSQTDRLFIADTGNHRVMVFGANVGGEPVEMSGEVASSSTTADENGNVSIALETTGGHQIVVDLPPGTTGENGNAIGILIEHIGGDPDLPAVLINAELPEGTTKSVTVPAVSVSHHICIVDKVFASVGEFPDCPPANQILTPDPGDCRARRIQGEPGDNPDNPKDDRGRHTINACTSDNGTSITISGLLHTLVAVANASETEAPNGPNQESSDPNLGGGGCSTGGNSRGLGLGLLLGLAIAATRRRKH